MEGMKSRILELRTWLAMKPSSDQVVLSDADMELELIALGDNHVENVM